jgi:hypothetical protein
VGPCWEEASEAEVMLPDRAEEAEEVEEADDAVEFETDDAKTLESLPNSLLSTCTQEYI